MDDFDSNVVGLIEIDTGLHAAVTGEGDDATLGQSLARLAGLGRTSGNSGECESWTRSPRYETQFLRADLDQLKGELEDSFHRLLQRLFEGD